MKPGETLPPHVRPGDRVGVVTPGSPVPARDVEATRQYFESRGYAVVVAPHVLASTGFLAGTAEERAADFNAMLRDPKVRMVCTSTGGSGSAQLLPLLDYRAFAADPKPVLALSDPANVLIGLTAVTGVPTFHGPNGVDFGGELTPFTEQNFWPLVGQELALPYAFPLGERVRVVRGGRAGEGAVWGGNLRRVQGLIGTPWLPDLRGAILFLEDIGFGLARMDVVFTHMRQAGLLAGLSGVILGELVDCEEPGLPLEETVADMLLRACGGYDYPILTDVPLGHTPDKLTLPLGRRVRLDAQGPALELLEPATA